MLVQLSHLQGTRQLSARPSLLPHIKLLFSSKVNTSSVCTGAKEAVRQHRGSNDTGIPYQHRQLSEKADKLLKAVYMMWNEQHVHGSCQWLAHNGA